MLTCTSLRGTSHRRVVMLCREIPKMAVPEITTRTSKQQGKDSASARSRSRGEKGAVPLDVLASSRLEWEEGVLQGVHLFEA